MALYELHIYYSKNLISAELIEFLSAVDMCGVHFCRKNIYCGNAQSYLIELTGSGHSYNHITGPPERILTW